MAQAPNIGRDRRDLIGVEICSTHGWHGGPILFGFRHAGSYRFGNRTVAAIAPQPLGVREIGAEGRACAGGAMAARAGRSADLTVVDAIAQYEHLLRRSVRNWKTRRFRGGAGIRVGAFRGFGVRCTDAASGCRSRSARIGPLARALPIQTPAGRTILSIPGSVGKPPKLTPLLNLVTQSV